MSDSSPLDLSARYDVLIVGGGSAGLSVAARLRLADPALSVGLLEPSDKHYYQPLWTMVGGGIVSKDVTERDEADFVPDGVAWHREAATAFDPDAKTVATDAGHRYGYGQLVVCPGIQVDYHKVEGLPDTLGAHGVCSNYSYEHLDHTWETVQRIANASKPVRALFTQPNTPVKCGGAPQKIMYLTADYLRRAGRLGERGANGGAEVHFFSPGKVLFGVAPFAKTLHKVVQRYGIDVHYSHNLVAVDGPKQLAFFDVTDDAGNVARVEQPFDMLHIAPPMSAPDFIKHSPLASDAGWVDVDKHTLQHARYADVFGLGDATNTPNAKTGAAIRKQAPVVVENLLAHRAGTPLTGHYDGYASCPLITGYGSLVLAEFDYTNTPAPSFPFDTTQERYSMYLLKRDVLPSLYWHGMLRGRA